MNIKPPSFTKERPSFKADSKRQILKVIERNLEHTAWGHGVYTKTYAVPGARPAQIRAGAKKLYDVIVAQQRLAQKQAVQG